MSELRAFLTDQLTLHGFTGICSDGCGCDLDNIAPCDNLNLDECSPGYRHMCDECPNQTDDNECPVVEDGGTGSCVSSSKEWPSGDPDA